MGNITWIEIFSLFLLSLVALGVYSVVYILRCLCGWLIKAGIVHDQSNRGVLNRRVGRN
jgi:hypothetical protein